MNQLKKRKFKYGGAAILLTAVVVALIVVLNVIIGALADHFVWYFDMTSENLYQLSDQSKTLLGEVDREENQVGIFFLCAEDRLNQGATSSNGYGQSTAWGMMPIHLLAKEMAENFDYISVDYLNLTTEPDRIREIVGDDYDDLNFSSTMVIVDNHRSYKDASGNVYDSSHEYRIFPRDTFYTYDYSTYAVTSFIGEYRFCAAIRAVTVGENERPIAYFLSGHGEEIGDYDYTSDDATTDYGNAQSLWQIFRDCGYTIRKIDLRYEDFDTDTPGVAVIYGPISDYITDTTSEQFDEIGKLNRYLSCKEHSMMVFLEPGNTRLSNLESFLKTHAGVSFGSTQLWDNGENSVSVNGYSIVGQPSDADGVAGQILSDLFSVYTDSQKAIFAYTGYLTFESGDRTSAIYSVPESSAAIASDGTKTYPGKDGAALMTLSETQSGGSILTCATTSVVDGVYMDYDAYVNRDLMLRVLDDMNDADRVSFGVKVKVIRDEGLDLTKRQATVLTVIGATALPIVFAGIGTVVYIRRRHS